MTDTLIAFRDVRFAYHLEPVLKNFDWCLLRGQHQALLGGNASGKTTIARLICDELRPQRGSIERYTDTHRIEYVSFDQQRELMELDRRFDDSELRDDAFDVGTTVQRAILGKANVDNLYRTLCERLGISHISERGIRFISTGESRKVLIARALYRNPELLILDNPLEGLDRDARPEMQHLLDELLDSATTLLLLTKDPADIPTRLTNIHSLPGPAATQAHWQLPPVPQQAEEIADPLLQLNGVNASFRGTPVLRDIHWTFARGQHAQISGPNGAGKSTLLGLLCGDNDKAYGQPVMLFGQRRGSGESIWDIKARFGVVSTALQLNHLKRLGVAEVVASGLFDSIGLYRDCGDADRRRVEQWLRALDLWALRRQRFHELSFGQQRLALLARAMVKWPAILILDEPCIGLDPAQRRQFLSAIDAIARSGASQLLYVSHRSEEVPACINQWLELVPHAEGGYTARVSG